MISFSGKRRPRRGGIVGALSNAYQAARALDPFGPGYYLRLTRAAMACQFEILLRPEDRSHLATEPAALDEIDRLENQMTVYRDDSEIMRLNRLAADAPVKVEPRLYGLLRMARSLGAETRGAFDISAGALIRASGFLDRRGRQPDPEELAAARMVSLNSANGSSGLQQFLLVLFRFAVGWHLFYQGLGKLVMSWAGSPARRR